MAPKRAFLKCSLTFRSMKNYLFLIYVDRGHRGSEVSKSVYNNSSRNDNSFIRRENCFGFYRNC